MSSTVLQHVSDLYSLFSNTLSRAQINEEELVKDADEIVNQIAISCLQQEVEETISGLKERLLRVYPSLNNVIQRIFARILKSEIESKELDEAARFSENYIFTTEILLIKLFKEKGSLPLPSIFIVKIKVFLRILSHRSIDNFFEKLIKRLPLDAKEASLKHQLMEMKKEVDKLFKEPEKSILDFDEPLVASAFIKTFLWQDCENQAIKCYKKMKRDPQDQVLRYTALADISLHLIKRKKLVVLRQFFQEKEYNTAEKAKYFWQSRPSYDLLKFKPSLQVQDELYKALACYCAIFVVPKELPPGILDALLDLYLDNEMIEEALQLYPYLKKEALIKIAEFFLSQDRKDKLKPLIDMEIKEFSVNTIMAFWRKGGVERSIACIAALFVDIEREWLRELVICQLNNNNLNLALQLILIGDVQEYPYYISLFNTVQYSSLKSKCLKILILKTLHSMQKDYAQKQKIILDLLEKVSKKEGEDLIFNGLVLIISGREINELPNDKRELQIDGDKLVNFIQDNKEVETPSWKEFVKKIIKLLLYKKDFVSANKMGCLI